MRCSSESGYNDRYSGAELGCAMATPHKATSMQKSVDTFRAHRMVDLQLQRFLLILNPSRHFGEGDGATELVSA